MTRLERSEKRWDHRYPAEIEAALRQSTAKPIKISVKDLSHGGFRTEWPHTLNKGDRVWLRLPGTEALAATVQWVDQFEVGCRFEHQLHPAVLQNILKNGRDPSGWVRTSA